MNKLGNDLADPKTNKKAYWKMLNRVMNRCKATRIPPILVNNCFIISAKDKASEFIKYFTSQCTPMANDSVLPHFHYNTNERLDQIVVNGEDILPLI